MRNALRHTFLAVVKITKSLGKELKLKFPPKITKEALQNIIIKNLKKNSNSSQDVTGKDGPVHWSPLSNKLNSSPVKIVNKFPEKGVRITSISGAYPEKNDVTGNCKICPWEKPSSKPRTVLKKNHPTHEPRITRKSNISDNGAPSTCCVDASRTSANTRHLPAVFIKRQDHCTLGKRR